MWTTVMVNPGWAQPGWDHQGHQWCLPPPRLPEVFASPRLPVVFTSARLPVVFASARLPVVFASPTPVVRFYENECTTNSDFNMGND